MYVSVQSQKPALQWLSFVYVLSLREIEHAPDIIVFHSLTNELREKSAESCVNKMKEIVSLAGELYPSSNVIISTPTPRADKESFNMKGQLISVLLKQEYFDTEEIYLCDRSYLANKGRAVPRYLCEDDKYHLSDHGVNVFAANIRDVVDEALDLPKRRPFYNSNVNPNDGSRGGYRGCGGYRSRGGYRARGHNNYNNYQSRGRGYGSLNILILNYLNYLKKEDKVASYN